jgi:TIR domain
MATPEPDPTVPKTFISYSWDDDAHKEWVKQLATRLRMDGVDVTLDRWHAAPGDQIPAFMERAVRENDFVIAVCTPRFKERSDGRGGGVGYEGDIMTAYAFTGGDKRKFIPVLRRGSWREAALTWLLGRAKIDLSRDPYSESEYEELLRTLHGAREGAPPIGHRPNFGDKKGSQASPAPAPVTPLVGSSTPQHQSSITPRVMILFLILTLLFAVGGLITYAYTSRAQPNGSGGVGQITYAYTSRAQPNGSGGVGQVRRADNVELVDASFYEGDKETSGMPTIDIKLLNSCSITCFVKSFRINIKKTWVFEQEPIEHPPMFPSAAYYIVLPYKPAPFSITRKISHTLQPNEAERFLISFSGDSGKAFLINVEIAYNAGDTKLTTPDMLFITEHDPICLTSQNKQIAEKIAALGKIVSPDLSDVLEQVRSRDAGSTRRRRFFGKASGKSATTGRAGGMAPGVPAKESPVVRVTRLGDPYGSPMTGDAETDRLIEEVKGRE